MTKRGWSGSASASFDKELAAPRLCQLPLLSASPSSSLQDFSGPASFSREKYFFFKSLFYYLNPHLQIVSGGGWFVMVINTGAVQPR